jgi:histidinol dehydrogenase
MSLTRLDLRGVPAGEMAAKVSRPASAVDLPTEEVKAILAEVRSGGDAAVRELTQKFDGVELGSLRVPEELLREAREAIDPALGEALELAYSRIVAYHRHEPASVGDFELDGVTVRQLVRPVARAGLYAPGGRARYPSTVLMCAAPARVAGVEELALCVPPGPDGKVDPATLAAAAVAGVNEVYRIGGAQAVGAMAFGTETVPPVDVIAGPGNRYVAEAKRQVSGLVGVPSAFAGPSEVVVVADDTAPAKWVAADVVVQAEHGPDGLAWLVSWSESVADQVTAEIGRIVASSPRRRDLESTLGSGGTVALVDGPEEAVALANAVAPEHLELLVDRDRAMDLLPSVRSAGAVFCGPLSPASMGDYLAGPNHVLPTARTARFSSALRVDDFRVHIHAVSVGPEAMARLGPSVSVIAEAEGLPAHALSVRLRMEGPQSMGGSQAPVGSEGDSVSTRPGRGGAP